LRLPYHGHGVEHDGTSSAARTARCTRAPWDWSIGFDVSVATGNCFEYGPLRTLGAPADLRPPLAELIPDRNARFRASCRPGGRCRSLPSAPPSLPRNRRHSTEAVQKVPQQSRSFVRNRLTATVISRTSPGLSRFPSGVVASDATRIDEQSRRACKAAGRPTDLPGATLPLPLGNSNVNSASDAVDVDLRILGHSVPVAFCGLAVARKDEIPGRGPRSPAPQRQRIGRYLPTGTSTPRLRSGQ